MTKFIDGRMYEENIKKEKKKTRLTHYLSHDRVVRKLNLKDKDWLPANLVLILSDAPYGDVFIGWNRLTPDKKIIFFGEKGDEFNN